MVLELFTETIDALNSIWLIIQNLWTLLYYLFMNIVWVVFYPAICAYNSGWSYWVFIYSVFSVSYNNVINIFNIEANIFDFYFLSILPPIWTSLIFLQVQIILYLKAYYLVKSWIPTVSGGT